MSISIIIPTINLAYLRQLLDSIVQAQFGRMHSEVIIIYDGPKENIAAFDKLLIQYRQTIDIKSKTTQGFEGPSKARNAGAELASKSLLLFLDDDTHLRPDFFIQLFDQRTEYNYAYLMHVAHSPRLYQSDDAQYLRATWLNLPDKLLNHSDLEVLDWRMMQTCCLFIPKFIFDDLGGFNENFSKPHYEDLEFSTRFHKAGYLLRYYKKCVVYHYNYRSISAHMKWSRNNGYWKRVFSIQYPEYMDTVTWVKRNGTRMNLQNVDLITKEEKRRCMEDLNQLFYEKSPQKKGEFTKKLIELGVTLEAETFMQDHPLLTPAY